jgi:hypothetical protein
MSITLLHPAARESLLARFARLLRLLSEPT